MHGPHGDPGELTGADALGVFDVNVFGVVRTTTAFLPLLRRSSDPVVINVSSGMGSLALTHDPSRAESSAVAPLYAASKAALTMLTTQYAKGLKDIRVNAADPGYTATDLNGHSGPQSVTEGTDAIVRLATEGPGSRLGTLHRPHRPDRPLLKQRGGSSRVGRHIGRENRRTGPEGQRALSCRGVTMVRNGMVTTRASGCSTSTSTSSGCHPRRWYSGTSGGRREQERVRRTHRAGVLECRRDHQPSQPLAPHVGCDGHSADPHDLRPGVADRDGQP